MDENKLTEERLEQVLKELPEISSTVSKSEFQRRVMIEVNRQHVKQKKSNRLFYSLASIGLIAGITVFGLVPILNDKEEQMSLEMARFSEMTENKQEMDNEIAEVPEMLDIEGPNFTMLEERPIFYNSLALYEDILAEDEELIEYYVIDESVQYVVPFTIKVNNKENLSKFELYEKYQNTFDERKFGLAETYPVPHRLSVVDNSLHIDVDESFPGSLGTAGEGKFFTIANYFTEAFDFENVKLFTEGEEGITFSHVGTPSYQYELSETQFNVYYLYYQTEDKSEAPLLAKRFGNALSLDEAFEAMYKDDVSSRIYSAFPKDLQFYYEDSGDILNIHFTNGVASLYDTQYWYTIDVILAVAKAAGYTGVQFFGTDNNFVGPYNLDGIINVPRAYNQIVVEQ